MFGIIPKLNHMLCPLCLNHVTQYLTHHHTHYPLYYYLYPHLNQRIHHHHPPPHLPLKLMFGTNPPNN